MGAIELEFLPDKAPETVRKFLRLAQAGVYDGMAVHRVVPNFVIQTGALAFRDSPLVGHATEARREPAARVHGHAERAGHRLDGARRRSGQRIDVVLHLHRRMPLRSTASTRSSRAWSRAWTCSGDRASPVDGETPRTPVTLTRVRLSKVP